MSISTTKSVLISWQRNIFFLCLLKVKMGKGERASLGVYPLPLSSSDISQGLSEECPAVMKLF